MVVRCVSVDTTILHTFLSAPACTACTDMVSSNSDTILGPRLEGTRA